MLASRPSIGLHERVDEAIFLRIKGQDKYSVNGQPGLQKPVQPRRVQRRVQLLCPTPQVTDVGPHSASLKWSSMESAGTDLKDVAYCLDVQTLDSTGKVQVPWRLCYKGTSTSYQISDLQAGHRHMVRLSATIPPTTSLIQRDSSASATLDADKAVPLEEELVYECQPSTSETFRTQPTSPGAPAPPSLSARTRNSLKLKWNSPDDPGTDAGLVYVLFISPPPAGQDASPPGSQDSFVEVYRGDEKSFKVAKLLAGVRYMAQLQVLNPLGTSPLSACSAFTTQATVPSPPDPPHTVANTASSITLSWVPPYDNGAPISAYQLEGDDGWGSSDYHLVYAGIKTSATANDLKSGLTYRFRVRAENSEGKSSWSASSSATTAAAPPASPLGITLVAAQRNAATVSWSPPTDCGGAPVTSFEVQLQAKTRAAVDHMGLDWLLIFAGEATACTINSLRPGCTYRARVRACNSAGGGAYCLPLDVTTAADVPDVAGVPVQTLLLPHSVCLQWSAPKHDGGAKVSAFRLELSEPVCVCGMCQPGQPRRCDSSAIKLAYSGAAACAEVCALEAGSSYHFRVQAVNSHGAGPWSTWVALDTPAAPPMECAPPQVSRATAGSFLARWSPPNAQGTPLTAYTLDLARVGPAPRHSTQPGAQAPSALLHALQPETVLAFRTVYRGTDPTFECKGLDPVTLYLVRVSASNAAGHGPWSANTVAATTPAAPGAPEGLAAKAAGPHAMALTWRPPALDNGAPVTSYVAEYCSGMAAPVSAAGGTSGRARGSVGTGGASAAPGGAVAWQVVYQGDTEACFVDGLQPGKRYSFRVKASNAFGFSPTCAATCGTTAPAPPGRPSRPVAGQRTATGVRLRWEEVFADHGAPVAQYSVEQYSGEADGSEGPGAWEAVYCGRETVCRLTGLQPGHRYSFRVVASNVAGPSEPSLVEHVLTLLSPPGPPTSISAEFTESVPGDPSGAAAVVTWSCPEAHSPFTAEAMSYEVVALAPGLDLSAASTVRQVVVGKTASSARLAGLHAGTQYVVRLRSVGCDATGHSPWSADAVLAVPGAAAAEWGMSYRSSASGSTADLSEVASGASTSTAGGTAGRRTAASAARKAAQAARRAVPPSARPPPAARPVAPSPPPSISAAAPSAVRSKAPRSTDKQRSLAASGVAAVAAKAPPVRRSVWQRLWRLALKYLWQLLAVVLMVVAVCLVMGR